MRIKICACSYLCKFRRRRLIIKLFLHLLILLFTSFSAFSLASYLLRMPLPFFIDSSPNRFTYLSTSPLLTSFTAFLITFVCTYLSVCLFTWLPLDPLLFESTSAYAVTVLPTSSVYLFQLLWAKVGNTWCLCKLSKNLANILPFSDFSINRIGNQHVHSFIFASEKKNSFKIRITWRLHQQSDILKLFKITMEWNQDGEIYFFNISDK